MQSFEPLPAQKKNRKLTEFASMVPYTEPGEQRFGSLCLLHRARKRRPSRLNVGRHQPHRALIR